MSLSREYSAPLLYIDGDWIGADARESEPVYNPATAQEIGRVPHATSTDLDRAVEAAGRAFPAWAALSADERGKILLRAQALIRERATEIARVATLENGKNYREALAEVQRSSGTLSWYAEVAKRAYGRVIPSDASTRLYTVREPIGPVAAFVPWNFPSGGPLRKLSAGLAAGCTFVIKCSEETPATAVQLVKCFEDAGVPAGVINLVFGDPPMISEHLIAASPIRMVAFTGSVPVGKLIAQHAAKVMKPCIMELGGHAPVIVAEDADPVMAAKRSAFGKFINSGQVCTSPTRFIVHERHHEVFVETFVEAAKALKIGDGLDDGVQMGPLANPRRLDAMERLVQNALEKGARLALGGKRMGNQGWFFEPTVLTEVPLDADIMIEEPFGPVVPIVRFSSLDTALEIANSTAYGLAAYCFTESAATAERITNALEAGILSVNHTGGSVHEAPSGGVKESGYGREGGEEGFEAYQIVKRVSHKFN
jgi:succinate-semialdehyde dehydrogenase/glutarate-semialdehyde dehydrogenase|tara:strand:+ start:18600 stop:20045 length:1446 start_codon:yes stop_codon:yes gene_type:complete